MKKRLYYLILPIITIVLELLPYGAVCNFANPEGEPFRKTFSYFSLTPFGYANFAPFITAVISCLIFVLLVLFCANGNKKRAIFAKNASYAAAIVSLAPLTLGASYFSFVAVLITLSLIAEAVLLQIKIKKKADKS